MIHPTRIKVLKPGLTSKKPSGKGLYVLLWVQSSVRTHHNHALEYAVQQANQKQQPLVAVFGLTPNYPEANARHYQFLLEGLKDLRENLALRGIPLQITLGHPPETALQAAHHSPQQASLVITDVGYLRHHRQWRTWLSQQLHVPLVQVESEAIIPVRTTSHKAEYAARTIRPKIHQLWHDYLQPLTPHDLHHHTNDWNPGLNITHPTHTTRTLNIDHTVPPGHQQGGELQAQRTLKHFITHHLSGYGQRRNDPTLDSTSHLSAYLHYGHLSPLTAALAALSHPSPDTNTFLEELIIRRELSFNHTTFNDQYDQYEGLPNWAQTTLNTHAHDPRPHLYTLQELTEAQTHDPYWNAAQRQMTTTGHMHNYMRMYWGKKILEWTPQPRQAHATMLHLNNRYQQDGRDPNSYAGIGWVLGLHDRPWATRPIYGTVRSMTTAGLKRKFDMDTYANKWNKPERE